MFCSLLKLVRFSSGSSLSFEDRGAANFFRCSMSPWKERSRTFISRGFLNSDLFSTLLLHEAPDDLGELEEASDVAEGVAPGTVVSGA